jgi:membrane protease YdiL (CAAX protease family)
MAPDLTPATPAAARPAWTTTAMLAGFSATVLLRLAVGTPRPATSLPAGLTFAAALTALTVTAPTRTRGGRTRAWVPTLAWATAGTAVLCAPALLTHLSTVGTAAPQLTGYLHWAPTVAAVATAEEAFLRGTLYTHLDTHHGSAAAILVSTACFTAMHIPLYGWHTAVLNTAAGLWLATLRRQTGTWVTPAFAHTATDLFAWWLR